MSELVSMRPHADAHSTSPRRLRDARAPPSPRQNRLLAALPPRLCDRLLAELQLVPLPAGWTLYGAGNPEKVLYFPTSGIVSRCYVTHDGTSAQFAVTGNEGFLGVAAFLGAGRTFTQAGQSAVCNRHHLLDQQLCCWFLSMLDRLPTNELAIMQELIASVLGVRRESITTAAGKLQEEGAIHYSRGHIAVLDRPRLAARACECYAVVKREFDRLFPPHTEAAPGPPAWRASPRAAA